jgi:hypothetical protein
MLLRIRIVLLVFVSSVASCGKQPAELEPDSPLPPPADLRFTAQVMQLGPPVHSVSAFVRIWNRGGQEGRVEYRAGCGMPLILMDSVGAIVWDEYAYYMGRPGLCKAPPGARAIRPGESVDVNKGAISLLELMGDSIASGVYPSFVRFSIVAPMDTTLLLPAGSLTLSR